MTQGAQIRCPVTAWEGWDGVGGGTEAQEEEDLYTPKADSC